MPQNLVDQFRQIPSLKKRYFRRRILQWYASNRRDFPWRNTKDGYAVLIAEIMLQQTNADLVVTIYEDFIRQFPSPNELALASMDQVEKYVSKIGLKYRTLDDQVFRT